VGVRAVTRICVALAIDRIAISLTVNGVVIDREVFSDAESGSQHASDHMYTYDARGPSGALLHVTRRRQDAPGRHN
jgi:hypothetical protein